jgi:hypothetical protein
MKQFSREIDEELVAYIDEFCANGEKNPLQLDPEDIKPKPSELVYYPNLEKMKTPKI